MIRFNTRVDYVGMLDYGVCSNDLKWVVRSEDKKSEKTVKWLLGTCSSSLSKSNGKV